jgi:hypothetical protein
VSRVMPRLLPQAQCVALMSMPAIVTMCDAQGSGGAAGARVLAVRAADLIMRLGHGGEGIEGEGEGHAHLQEEGGDIERELESMETSVAYVLGVVRELGRVCHPVEAEGRGGAWPDATCFLLCVAVLWRGVLGQGYVSTPWRYRHRRRVAGVAKSVSSHHLRRRPGLPRRLLPHGERPRAPADRPQALP